MTQVLLPQKRIFNLLSTKALVAIIGVGVLALGVKVVWFDQTRYLVPAQYVPEGAKLANQKWQSVSLNLGLLGSRYLTANQRPKGFAAQGLPSGSLVSLKQTVAVSPGVLSRVVINNKTALGSGVHAGASVSIWCTRRIAAGTYDAPQQLVARASVGKIIKTGAVFGATSQQVEVLVKPTQTAALLDAMATDSPLFLIAGQ